MKNKFLKHLGCFTFLAFLFGLTSHPVYAQEQEGTEQLPEEEQVPNEMSVEMTEDPAIEEEPILHPNEAQDDPMDQLIEGTDLPNRYAFPGTQEGVEFVNPKNVANEYPIRVDRSGDSIKDQDTVYKKAGVTWDQVRGDLMVKVIFDDKIISRNLVPESLSLYYSTVAVETAYAIANPSNDWTVVFDGFPRIDALYENRAQVIRLGPAPAYDDELEILWPEYIDENTPSNAATFFEVGSRADGFIALYIYLLEDNNEMIPPFIYMDLDQSESTTLNPMSVSYNNVEVADEIQTSTKQNIMSLVSAGIASLLGLALLTKKEFE